jgi:hypothetical protein
MAASTTPSVTTVVKSGGRTTTGPAPVQATMGPIGTAKRIVQREGFLALYKGLTAVYTGIIPKMAIRFLSFEQYKELLAFGRDKAGMQGQVSPHCDYLYGGIDEWIDRSHFGRDSGGSV